MFFPLPNATYPSDTCTSHRTLTCDDAGEGAAHRHRGERRGRPAKGRHDRGRPAEGREGGRVTVVAVVVRLHGRRVTHQGGVGPVVAQVGVNWRGIGVIGSVLERRALVLFTPHATHCQACRRRELDSAVSQAVVHVRNVYLVSKY